MARGHFQRAKSQDDDVIDELEARAEAAAWADRIGSPTARPVTAADMAKGILGRYRAGRAALR